MSYCCDRARSIAWGIEGGLPSLPHGVWLNPGTETARFLGAVFSNVPIGPGDMFTRPSAGGGGYGDPLERDPDRVCEDVTDGYVSIERALKDYGVVVREIDADLAEYEVDLEATDAARERHRAASGSAGWPRTPRASRRATATASSTCSTSSATTASSSTGAPASSYRRPR